MAKKQPTGNDRRLRWGDGWIEERTRADDTIRYVARWREPTSAGVERVVSRSFPTLEAAEAHLRTVADRIANGSYIAPEELTVGELVTRWIERGASEWAESTSANYREWARMGIVPLLKSVRVSTLNAPRVQHWVDSLAARGLASGSIHDCFFVLRAALKDAVRLGIITSNPAEGTRLPTNRAKKPPTWTAQEAQVALAAVADDVLWHAAYRLHLATGMRPGEIRALRWSDLDTAAGTITVRRTMTQNRQRRPTIGERTKTGKVRAIALTPPTLAALSAWRKAQLTTRMAAPSWAEPDAMFTIPSGAYISSARWANYLEDLIARTGVKRITPHGIRHTAATLMLERGVHPKVVADILGHSSVTITLDRYSHVSVDLQRAAVAALDELLRGDDSANDVVAL
jgi:integrase